MQRDHTKLLCDISEMSGLFSNTRGLQSFLEKIVEMVTGHMDCDVCSIYLFDDKQKDLVLTATKGLNADSIGKVRLKLGEGLTGLAVQEGRALCEACASKNPSYKFFPESGEAPYESFLAVPILRGQTRIGALVIQNHEIGCFSDEDIKVFRAVTSQLAMTIETAKLLISLEDQREILENPNGLLNIKFIKGKVGSEGFAYADVALFDQANLLATSDFHDHHKKYTLQDFHAAIELTEKELIGLQKKVEEKLSDVASLIFTAQILMLKDETFIALIEAKIADGVNPPVAIQEAVWHYSMMLDKLESAYLQEKKEDIKDIGKILIEKLLGESVGAGDVKDKIVIARELFSSDILKLASQEVKGVLLLSGGTTSHICILARSLNIPLVIVNKKELLQVPPGTKLLLDGHQGNIYFNPDTDIVETFRKKEITAERVDLYRDVLHEAAVTKDGVSVVLMANINLLNDVNAARDVNADGIGLYRTEFPFIVRSTFPTEEEQFVIYKKLVNQMKDKEITFRTLDIGGDKVLSYYDFQNENNPFLGMRSIRFSLQHRDVFQQQIRAILRAGVDAEKIRIMFPMISSMDEFIEAKSEVVLCQKYLKAEKIPYHKTPQIGMMVELPAVMEIIEELAQEADFFSIGTNDFIQYMLAVDRTNEKVADLYLPHHPAILRALRKVILAGQKYNIDVSICGDMAHKRKYLEYLIGIGVRKFSLDPRHLLKIKKAVRELDSKVAEAKALQILKQSTILSINSVINLE